MSPPVELQRCGMVAIVGAPNVGKSSLLNCFVGTKVSIVSPKVQTTRRRVIGVAIEGDAQLCFVDTPGIFEPREGKKLERAIVRAAWSGLADADIPLFVVDAARGLDRDARRVLDKIAETKGPAFLAINKMDKVRVEAALPIAKQANDARMFDETFMLSAETGEGLDAVLPAIAEKAQKGPWLFPEDQLSDLSNRALAAEITREHLFRQLRQELPYALTVETEAWTENEEGDQARIDQVIYVERASQKAIVLGKGGARIKEVGAAARKELEELLSMRLHLFLFVKVRERWTDDPERYREQGLDFER